MPNKATDKYAAQMLRAAMAASADVSDVILEWPTHRELVEASQAGPDASIEVAFPAADGIVSISVKDGVINSKGTMSMRYLVLNKITVSPLFDDGVSYVFEGTTSEGMLYKVYIEPPFNHYLYRGVDRASL